MRKSIDWDMYVANNAYNDVLETVSFARKVMPTMFSKCKQFIYLTSLDLDYKIDDIVTLQEVLKDIKKQLKSSTKEFQDTPSLSLIEKLYLCKVEYIVLCRLISDASNGNIEYHPESIFYEMENS